MTTRSKSRQFGKAQLFKKFPLGRLAFVVFALLLVIGGTIIGVSDSQKSLMHIPIPIIVSALFVILGVIFVLLQFFVPLYYPSSPIRPSTPPKSSPPSSSRSARLSTPPKSPPSNKAISYINAGPPSTNPKTIQPRRKDVSDVYRALIQPDVTAIALRGITGVGKSTLAIMVYNYAEEQHSAGKGPFTAKALWVKINTSDTMTDLATVLFNGFEEPLPDFENFAPQELAQALFDVLNITERLVVLDQFDNLLEVKRGQLPSGQSKLDEWLDMLNKQVSTSRVLFVSGFWPQMTFNHIRDYHVKGFEPAEGIKLLRKLEVKGTEEELLTAVEYCEGHPFALRLLATFLHDYCLSLTAFFKDPKYAKLWLRDVALHRFEYDDIFRQQFSPVQWKLLAAFSIYREPIPLNAAKALLDPQAELTIEELLPALDILLAEDLITELGKSRYELEKKQYRLHPIVASYAQSHYIEGGEQNNMQVLQEAHNRAAHYYLDQANKICPPRDQRQSINDVHPLIEAFWQLCQAHHYQDAYDLMEREHIFSNLRHWKENAILLDLYQMLLPLEKWHPSPLQEIVLYSSMGVVYHLLGQKKLAVNYFEQALYIRRELRDQEGEILALRNLGQVYAEMGKKNEALGYIEQALAISRKMEDRWEEGRTLKNLGQVFADFEEYEEALKYYEQALRVLEEVGDRRDESRTLKNMAQVYSILGLETEAKKYADKALSIDREIGEHKVEGRILHHSDRLHDEQHRKKMHLEQTLKINQKEGNREKEVLTLHNLGRTYYELGQKKEAREFFVRAFHVRMEEGDRRNVARSLQNIGLLYYEQRHYEAALASLLLAKEIFDEVQSPDREKSQKWIDILCRKVGKERFDQLLEKVGSQPGKIVEQELNRVE